jgi:hypothetical protein
MTQKSLVYMVLAVAVGYILVSAVPNQISMYTTPQPILSRGDGNDTNTTRPLDEDFLNETGVLTSSPETEEARSESFLYSTQLPHLMMWWTIDVIVALTIYWVAKNRLS